MKIPYQSVSCNRAGLVAHTGSVVPAAISSAWNYPAITEDIFLEPSSPVASGTYYPFVPFMIIPMREGVINVQLASGLNYTIQEAEVSASIGAPLLYLVTRIFAEGTTVTNLTVGI
jgi:hypothetical protein